MDHQAEARFGEWAAARAPSLHRFAFVLCGDWHLAEDLVQEALARAALHWTRLERFENTDAYVRRILVNQLTSLRRRRAWRMTLPGDPLEPAVPDESDAHARDDELLSALRRLPVRQRAVITLRYFEGLSEQEAAEILGCSLGTVKSQAHKAMQSLRRSLVREEVPC